MITITNGQIGRAEEFQHLHKNDELFIIPNVWNAGSAVIFEKAGFKSVATTSAGIAFALGYADGEDISLNDLSLVVRQITSRINIPLSVDFERGYAETAEEIKDNAFALIDAGAVGFNIEDGRTDGTIDDLEHILMKIKVLVEVRRETNLQFVINARTCAYWLNYGNEKERLQLVIDRCNSFANAGADCVFVPGAISETDAEALVDGIKAPLNLIANPLFNDFEKMNEIGVRRISIGSGAVRSVFNHLINLSSNLKNNDISEMINHKFSYAAANDFFKK